MPESLLKELSINMAPPGDTVDEITKNIGNIANLTTSTDGIPIRYKEISKKDDDGKSDVVISKVVIAEGVLKDDKIEPKLEKVPTSEPSSASEHFTEHSSASAPTSPPPVNEEILQIERLIEDKMSHLTNNKKDRLGTELKRLTIDDKVPSLITRRRNDKVINYKKFL
ncbi:unnamed protein product [[Candida] boidinii]|nr:unnamed protein product [[Candida] boidinii]